MSSDEILMNEIIREEKKQQAENDLDVAPEKVSNFFDLLPKKSTTFIHKIPMKQVTLNKVDMCADSSIDQVKRPYRFGGSFNQNMGKS